MVDLDRTFLSFDTFRCDLRAVLSKKPWYLFFLIKILMKKGLAETKYQFALLHPQKKEDYRTNPFFFQYLMRQKNRPLWLVTGASEVHAQSIQRFYPFFTECYASNRQKNCSVAVKQEWLNKKGVTVYDYAGDRLGDYVLFQHARTACIVNPSFALFVKLSIFPLKNCQFFDVHPFKKALFFWLKPTAEKSV